MRYTPQVEEAVRRAKHNGVPNKEIAMAMGLTDNQVRGLCRMRRFKRRTSGRLKVPVGQRLMKELHAEAVRRGMAFDPFMRLLLLTIVDDNLFAAILDDGK